MFQNTIGGTSLRSNLIHDQFFGEHNNTLTIIDDYNIVDIKDGAVNFYIESFEGVGVTNIDIYFQVKKISKKRRQEINNLAHTYGLDSNKLLCYCVFVRKGFPKWGSIKELVFSQRPLEEVDKALYFINRMKEIGITVTLHPYSSLNFNPPFHGRYWLTDEKGYIVDASMQTYGSGLIFAQLMDAENFYIIKRELFDTRIKNNANEFEPLTKQDLDDIINKVHPYHCLGR